jgi:hypothetical protein
MWSGERGRQLRKILRKSTVLMNGYHYSALVLCCVSGVSGVSGDLVDIWNAFADLRGSRRSFKHVCMYIKISLTSEPLRIQLWLQIRITPSYSLTFADRSSVRTRSKLVD